MRPVGAERQRLDPKHASGIERSVKVREQVAAPRPLPAQRRPQSGGIDRDEQQIVLPRKVLGRRFAQLVVGGKVDEAVGKVDRRAVENALRVSLRPKMSRQNLVDRTRIRQTSSQLRHIFLDAAARGGDKVLISTESMMAQTLSHHQVWRAIDTLATRHGLSPSGLAKRAGLDPTTFNRSKRVSADGRDRWPSTESIAKILAATGEGVDDFLQLLTADAATPKRRPLPLLGFAQAGLGGYFDDAGFPTGAGWDEIEAPAVADEHAYALEISGDSMTPLFRDGDVVIVSPGSPVRRGDRVVVRTKEGEVLAKELKRRTAKTIELKSLNAAYDDRVLGFADVSWVARIVWSSH